MLFKKQGEYYDLDKDYFELDNIWSTLNGNQVSQYKAKINTFMNCQGQKECNSLRIKDETERKYYFDYIKDKLVKV